MHDNPRQALYLLRHAHAEPWTPDTEDFDRRLDQRGRSHMQKMAAWLKTALEPPEVVLCSPAARARETLAGLATAWTDFVEMTHYRPGIYEATPGTLLALLGEAFRYADTVLLVGHNPGLEYLVRAVLRPADREKITNMQVGTLAVIDFEGGWERSSGGGILRHWVTRVEP